MFCQTVAQTDLKNPFCSLKVLNWPGYFTGSSDSVHKTAILRAKLDLNDLFYFFLFIYLFLKARGCFSPRSCRQFPLNSRREGEQEGRKRSLL